MTSLTVLRAGLQTTVQDLGRYGWSRYGVPVAGALDPAALAAANRSVGNPDDAAGLECVLRGPTLAADADSWLAAVGAGWSLGPVPLTAGVPYAIGTQPAGLRCWVAVSGGIASQPVLGSRSTDTLSGLGGRPLRDGDVLPLGLAGPVGRPAVAGPDLPEAPVLLRFTAGPQASRLLRPLAGATFTTSRRSDRTAVRFEGEPLPADPGDIKTTGVLPGVLQLPPDGLPILLLANCQSTGGYPVVGVVCSADLRLAAQLRPGTPVLLAQISVDEARAQAAD